MRSIRNLAGVILKTPWGTVDPLGFLSSLPRNDEAIGQHKTTAHYKGWADFKAAGGVENQAVIKLETVSRYWTVATYNSLTYRRRDCILMYIDLYSNCTPKDVFSDQHPFLSYVFTSLGGGGVESVMEAEKNERGSKNQRSI